MRVNGFIRRRDDTHPCLLRSSGVGCLRRVPSVSPRAPRRDAWCGLQRRISQPAATRPLCLRDDIPPQCCCCSSLRECWGIMIARWGERGENRRQKTPGAVQTIVSWFPSRLLAESDCLSPAAKAKQGRAPSAPGLLWWEQRQEEGGGVAEHGGGDGIGGSKKGLLLERKKKDGNPPPQHPFFSSCPFLTPTRAVLSVFTGSGTHFLFHFSNLNLIPHLEVKGMRKMFH